MQPWEKGLAVAGSVAGFLALAWPIGSWLQVKVLEKPAYSVIRSLGQKRSLGWLTGDYGAELRQYKPYLIAEVEVKGAENMREALNRGFRKVASFIFGNNTSAVSPTPSKESVAMTSPVALEVAGGGSNEKVAMTSPVAAEMIRVGEQQVYRVSFTMPSKYTSTSLPKPKDPDVVIKEVPCRTLAALGFGGNLPSEEVVNQKAATLRAHLQAEGLVPAGPLHVWQYHPPFAPGFVRVNEVLYEVKL